MIQEVIKYYNTLLSAMPYFSNVYGISELKTAKGVTRPVTYTSGRYENLALNTKGTTYFRKRSDVIIQDADSSVSCSKAYSFTVPLLLFALTKRQDFPSSDAYSPDRLAAAIIRLISFKNGALKKTIGAISVSSSASGYSTNSQAIIQQEFAGLDRNDFNHDDIIISINVDLNIVSYRDCLIDPCDDEDILLLEDGDGLILEDGGSILL